MRKISSEIARAFIERRKRSIGNTRTDGTFLFLHGNVIAQRTTDGFIIRNAGWNTMTTKERLNALPGVSIHQAAFRWYLNGKLWDGTPEVISDHD